MKKIIATVGPSLSQKISLPKYSEVDLIYRINGAHGTISEIKTYINNIRKQKPDASILMDLPGNKVRTSDLTEGIHIETNKRFKLGFHNTNYPKFYSHLKIRDTIWANDSTFEFEVVDINKDEKVIEFLSKSNGLLKNNKGMHARGIHENIPFLFQKDIDLIQLANEMKLDYVGLSFVRNVDDILLAKEIIKPDIEIISKVETLSAVHNLKAILNEVEFILIDRGDLSTEVGLPNVPKFQRRIIRESKVLGVKVFLATQFLKNMEINPVPSIPEVMDLYSTIDSGIYGIQLSEETAVGNFPIECISFINKIVKVANNL